MGAGKEPKVMKVLLLYKRKSIYFEEIKTEPSIYSTGTKSIPNSGLSLSNTIIDHKKK
tara:strand:+ start:403 stop:576 length:174 start_codon:yes stop_codon:yes gene_type:complete